MRSLQPPDILWIHWRVYNFIVNTSKRVLFLPPSDAYVRSFLYLLYTLIKLYYTKSLSDQASSLAPDWILLLRGPRIPVYSRDSTTTFQFKHSWHCYTVRSATWDEQVKENNQDKESWVLPKVHVPGEESEYFCICASFLSGMLLCTCTCTCTCRTTCQYAYGYKLSEVT